MFITLLCVMFSSTLNFDNLTIQSLFDWYCQHPFLLMFAISEIFTMTINVKRK